MKDKKPYLLLVVGVLTMSFSGIILKKTNAPSPIIAFYRFFITAVILTPLFIKQARDAKDEPQPARKYFLIPFFTGLVNALDYAVGTVGLKGTSIANNAIFGNLSPVWVGLAMLFIFKKHLSGKYWLGMALAMIGSMLVLGYGYQLDPNLNIGDMCSIGSSLLYAIFFIMTEKGRVHYSATKFFVIMLYSSCFWLIVMNVIMGNSFIHYDRHTWALFFLSAVLCQLIGQFSISAALGYISSDIVSITMLLHPILMTVWAYPLLGESVNRMQLLGGVVTLIGVILVNTQKKHLTESK